MGWYGTYGQSIKECVAELTERKPWTAEDGTRHECVTVAKTYRGGTNGTLYAVQDRIVTPADGGPAIVTRFILVALIRYSREQTTYKDMDCCMGPSADSCPLKYVELLEAHPSHATDHSQYCAEWRQAIRTKAATKAEGRKVAKAAVPGARILAGGFPEPFVILEKRGRSLIVSGNGYGRARMSTSRVTALAS